MLFLLIFWNFPKKFPNKYFLIWIIGKMIIYLHDIFEKCCKICWIFIWVSLNLHYEWNLWLLIHYSNKLTAFEMRNLYRKPISIWLINFFQQSPTLLIDKFYADFITFILLQIRFWRLGVIKIYILCCIDLK